MQFHFTNDKFLARGGGLHVTRRRRDSKAGESAGVNHMSYVAVDPYLSHLTHSRLFLLI